MTRIVFLGAVFISSSAWAGMTAKDEDIQPKPNIAADLSSLSLQLKIADTIPATVTTSNEGIRPLEVEAWRAGLERGFQNGFAEAKGANAYTIELSRADFQVVPAAVNGASGVVGINANITKKALVADSAGQTACMAASTVSAKQAATTPKALGGMVGGAIESMFEDLAITCIAQLSAAPPPVAAPN
jgi:hypothetical protein